MNGHGEDFNSRKSSKIYAPLHIFQTCQKDWTGAFGGLILDHGPYVWHPWSRRKTTKTMKAEGVQRCATGFVMLPCRGISSPRDRSDAQCGSSGWSVGGGSACKTGTGRKWAGYMTRPLPDTCGPGCRYLQSEKAAVFPDYLKKKTSFEKQ